MDRQGKLYKTVRIFTVQIENEDPEKNGPMLKRTGDLQREEVDQISWCTSDEVKHLALYRYIDPIIKALNN